MLPPPHTHILVITCKGGLYFGFDLILSNQDTYTKNHLTRHWLSEKVDCPILPWLKCGPHFKRMFFMSTVYNTADPRHNRKPRMSSVGRCVHGIDSNVSWSWSPRLQVLLQMHTHIHTPCVHHQYFPCSVQWKYTQTFSKEIAPNISYPTFLQTSASRQMSIWGYLLIGCLIGISKNLANICSEKRILFFQYLW